MQHLALCLPAALVLIEGFSYEVRNVESRHLPPTDLQAISADTPPPGACSPPGPQPPGRISREAQGRNSGADYSLMVSGDKRNRGDKETTSRGGSDPGLGSGIATVIESEDEGRGGGGGGGDGRAGRR